MCRNTKAGATLKVIYTFASNGPALRTLIGTFATAFHLYIEKILDRPMIARCDLVVDAADMSIIFALVSGKQTPEDYPDGVEGMVQIKSFIPFYSSGDLNAGHQKIWEQLHPIINQALETDSLSKTPIGLLDFCLEGTEQVITIPVTVPDNSIESSRSLSRLGGACMKFVGKYVPIVQDTSVPLLINSSLTFVNIFRFFSVFTYLYISRIINMSILNDKKNLLRLRTHMPKEDLYKYVGSNINYAHLEALPTTTTVKIGKKEVRLQPVNIN